MADSKKYDGSQWEHSLRKLTTATDTITTLPADLYPNDTTATVGISGNMSQSGTPTSDNPIMPQGTGEMSSNLFDISTWNNATATRGTISISGNAITLTATSADCYTNTYSLSKYNIPVISGETYTLSWETDYESGIIYVFTGTTLAATVLAYAQSSKKSITVTVPNNHTVLSFRLGASSMGDIGVYSNIMLNSGSTALPYEPYGVKIPISSAGQTTPVYLGEVQTTRKIRKLVLTGEENITSGHLDVGIFNVPINDYLRAPILSSMCTHYKATQNISEWSHVPDKNTCFYVGIDEDFRQLYIRDSSYSTISDFKAYLAAQYAAGTPVTVWYILAEPTTSIVNEPLRKIGEYADTISGITIPTTAGANSFDVLTTLKPSEVSLSYTGWHDATVKEWDGSQ